MVYKTEEEKEKTRFPKRAETKTQKEEVNAKSKWGKMLCLLSFASRIFIVAERSFC